ncbi:uncharacterized protein LOC6569599 isoform X1 [Drosophila grimshawi]|nr:uncharacterized protein LOC6569599 isoform X1 [Drosophila grimshawi]
MADDLKLSYLHDIRFGDFIAHKAFWHNKEMIAISKFEFRFTKDDIELVTRLRHTNIIEIDYIQEYYLLIEYSDCGSLNSYLHGKEQREYTVRHVLSWMHQAALSMQYLHSMKAIRFLQRISTERLILFNQFRTLKISPISKIFNEYSANTSPELKAESIYSFGIIFWELMSRKTHLSRLGDDLPNPRRIPIINGEISLLNEIKIPNSEPIKELIEKCFNSDPDRRPAMEEILSDIENFLKSFDSSELDHVLTAGLIWDFAAIEMGEEMHKGTFGVTYKATLYHSTIVVKRLKQVMNENIKHQIRELIALSGKSVVSVLGIAMEGEFTYLLMEYIENGSLFDRIHNNTKPIPLHDVCAWMLLAVKAIGYLLSAMKMDIRFLCNLKSSNIMLSNNKVKLCNFCLAFDDKDVLKHNLDKSYIAPEVIKEGEYTEKSIVYTLCIILWEILARKMPFYNYQNQFQIKRAVVRGERPNIEDIPAVCTDELKLFLTKCWYEDPADRPQLEDLKRIFESGPNYMILSKKFDIVIIDFADININDILGDSQFGIVYRADWRDLEIGLKKYKQVLRNEVKSELEKEITRQSCFDHSNVVKLYGIGYIKEIAHLAMEYSDCGSLHNYLHSEEMQSYTVKPFCLHWMYQAAKGIEFLQTRPKSIIHCNLNSQNMLLFDNFKLLKISDYSFPGDIKSLAKYQDHAYVAPEVFEEDRYTRESDIYSFGIVFWEVMSRKKPFSQFEKHFKCNEIEEILKGKRPPLSDIIESEFNYTQTIIKRCWQANPLKRPTISKLVEELDKPEFVKVAKIEPEVFTVVDFADIQLGEECVEQGSFGAIYKANWCNKKIAVQHCKWISADFENLKDFASRVSHENIVKIFGIIAHKKDAFILMNYLECTTLHNYVHGGEKFEYTLARGLSWMAQCAKGLAYLHAMKPEPIYHNCLTTHNLLLTGNNRILKICNFGIPAKLSMPLEYEMYIKALSDFLRSEPNSWDIFCLVTILLEVMTRQTFDRSVTRHSPMFVLEGTEHIEGIIDALSTMKLEIEYIASFLESILITSESRIVSQVIRPMKKEEFKKLIDERSRSLRAKNVDFKDIKIVQIPTRDNPNKRINHILGSGAFGIVYKALWCDRTIALKEFRLERNSQSVLDSFNKELKMLESVHHENIVKLYGTSSHLETDYLLMEYAENGSLHDYLHGEEQRNYTMEDGIHWMIQLVKGMDYLHGRKPMPIIHRDLRPQNLLLTKNCKQLKIAHFGTGKELMTKNTTRIGTPGYLAPEVIQGLKYTEKCDTYSFGIIVWEVMSRRRPFDHLESRNTIVLLHKTVLKERPKLDVKLITDCNQLIELIESCWNHDPEKRPSAGSIQLSEIPCSDIYIVKPENQKN